MKHPLLANRRRSAAMVALALVLLAAGAMFAAVGSSATGPNAQLVSQSRVYGGGQFIIPPDNPSGPWRNFAVDAHSKGGTAYGDIEYGGPLHWGHEQVTCMNVVGNQATVGAVITQADRPSVIGWLALQVLQDNGNVLSDTPDAATFQVTGPGPGGTAGGWTAGFPDVCPKPDDALSFFGLNYFPLNGGDIVVQDAPSQ